MFQPDSSLAQGLVILDCQGITRAVHETPTNELNRVEVEVSDPQGGTIQGREVELVNNVTGTSFSSTVENNRVVFDGVPAGNYSIVVTGSSMSVGVITIGLSRLGLFASGGLVTGGLLVAGGSIAGGIEIADRISGGDGGRSPTPLPTPTPSGSSTPEPAPGQPTPAPSPTPTVCDCEPDAEPSPLSPFR